MFGLITKRKHEADMAEMRKTISNLQSKIDKIANRITPGGAPTRGSDPRKGKTVATPGGNAPHRKGGERRQERRMTQRDIDRHYLNKYGD